MTLLAHLADRVLNRPLLITPEKAQVIVQVLAGRIGVGSPDASRFEGDSFVLDETGKASPRPYRVKDGVGIITVTGSLVNRGAWVGASSGLTSYEGIQHQLKTARNDPAVQSVIIDLASPGGEAVGAFETAAAVRALAAEKCTVAIVNGMAASAAYAIASGANEIVTTETGVSGSIGVVLLHADFSRALANEGINPTLIFAGEHKVDGNPFAPLPDSVRADLQAEVDGFYDAFLKTIAKGRGSRLTAAGARKTEARTFVGQTAVDRGLADRVGTFDDVLSQLSRAPRGRANVQKRGTRMDNDQGAPAANAGFTQADLDRARAEGKAEGQKEGATAALTRIGAIAGAEGVKGNGARLSAALDLAMKAPTMSAEDVVAFVSANVADAAPAKSPAALENRGNVPDSLAAAGVGAAASDAAKTGWGAVAKSINTRA